MEKIQKEIKLLNAKKNQIYASLNSILDFSKKISTKDQKALTAFQVKVASLEHLRASFIETLDQYHLLNLEADESYEISYQPLDSFMEMFNVVTTAYSELESLVKKPASKDAAQSSSMPSPTVVPKLESSIKLPKLDLPTFSGESTAEWVVFYELFRTMVHERQDITNGQKCQYLLTKLKGKALATCSSIPATPENYNIIFQNLLDKYNDTRILASSYVDSLLNFKVSKTEGVQSLNHFVEKFGSTVAALKALVLDNLSDVILIHIAFSKLSPDIVKLFERTLKKDEVPTFENLLTFVRDQSKILTRVQPNSASYAPSSNNNNTSKPKATHNFMLRHQSAPADSSKACHLCAKGTHPLYRCPKFHTLAPRDRYSLVKNEGLCINCMGNKHNVKECSSKSVCSKCSKRHHSMLHFPVINHQPPPRDEPPAESSTHCNVSTFSLVGRSKPVSSSTVLLSTVQVLAFDRFGKPHKVRFLLDSGSQSHFITRSLCKQLNLDCGSAVTTVVTGLGSTSKPVLGEASVKIQSRISSSCSYNLEFLVVDTITSHLPSTPVQINADALRHIQNLALADESFGSPGEIQGLLGASIYPHLMLPGQVLGDSSGPIALNTTLGYVVVGAAPVLEKPSSRPFCGFVQTEPLEALVQRFWEQEDIPSTGPILSPAELEAETHFKETHVFDTAQQRYCVRLPFKEPPDSLGSSSEIALNRFLSLERKLEKNPVLREHYNAAISELLEADHLTPCQNDDGSGYFVSHHAVLREDKITSKCRIVFDFSCATSNGKSLNAILHSGPKLYNDLFDILLNLRLKKIALIADISKMFLQILLDPRDWQFQKIFWRFNKDDPLQVFYLTRVTFGSTSSPYLSQRVMRQLASDFEEEFPLVKPIICESFFMDDLTTSVHTVDEALELQEQLRKCFAKANMNLVKWGSNSLEFNNNIPREVSIGSLVDWNDSQSLKILGMGWNPSSDVFSFKVDIESRPCTKRVVLSNLARIWDPLGLISPVTLYCKLILQSLWEINLSWDDPAPPEVAATWSQVLSDLKLLSSIQIPRHISVVETSELMLVGMCDASERACAAVVYARVVSDQRVHVHLLASKSKLSPLKKISVARLELNGCLLLARLIQVVRANYQPRHHISRILCLSDSTVALHWINSSPHRWQTYVANRVTKIQELVPVEHWYHVPGKNNESADCLSRGLSPSQLLEHPTWFVGPTFLEEELTEWPIARIESSSSLLPEEKVATLVVTDPPRPFLLVLAESFSSWKLLTRTLVLIYRVIRKLPPRSNLNIEISELEFVEAQLWLAVQRTHFKLDDSNLRKLTPFVDSHGLIRVGGRLSNSNLTFEQKHPVLLPKNEHVVRLLVRYLHESNLHTGPAILLAITRQKYWILAARSLVRAVVHACNHCFRCNPRSSTPLMGNLPSYRVQEVKPFVNTGVDFAGPFSITLSQHRGVRTQKAYLCLFICLATKALHLELVSDLSTEAFVNALKRFLARRGPVTCIYSDNGTNFIGAKNMLNDIYKLLRTSAFREAYGKELVENRIEWKTLPPLASHFAGIWERSVRSVKTHLYKVIGCQILTYEQLETVFAQIESLINSTPLCVLSNDPNDPEPLTPAHFLKLTPLRHLPAAPVDDMKLNRLSRFQLLDHLVQSFWKRWTFEYLQSLQEKAKWNKPIDNIEIGTVVLLKDDNTLPLQWKLGIVQQIHPGNDGVVRVCSVRTKSGVFKRPVVKLCPLPTQ